MAAIKAGQGKTKLSSVAGLVCVVECWDLFIYFYKLSEAEQTLFLDRILDWE